LSQDAENEDIHAQDSRTLRLSRQLGRSQRQVARSVRMGQSTVWDYLTRFRLSGLSFEQAEALDDEALEQRLFPSEQLATQRHRSLPDGSKLHQEFKRKGVTLSLLWQEYREGHLEGYANSRFCALYRDWKKTLDVTLRQHHAAGETLFVDYAGQTVQEPCATFRRSVFFPPNDTPLSMLRKT
jgi:transposase